MQTPDTKPTKMAVEAAKATSSLLQGAMANALEAKLLSQDEISRLKLLNKALGKPYNSDGFARLISDASKAAGDLDARLRRAKGTADAAAVYLAPAPPIPPAPTVGTAIPAATAEAPARCPILNGDTTTTHSMIRASVVIVVQNRSMSRREAAASLRALAAGQASALAMALPQGCVYEVVRKYRSITPSTVGRWVAEASESGARAAASGTIAAPLSDTLRHGNATRKRERPPIAEHLWQLHALFPQLSIARLGEMLRKEGKTKLSSRQLQYIVRDHFGAKWVLLTFGGDATEKELLSLRLAWETPHSNDVWIMDHSYLRLQPGQEEREKIPFWYLDDDRRMKQDILMATVIMDACSRRILNQRIWPFAPTARENMLVLFDALRRFGKPRILYTDNGADLVCEDMREVLILLGIELRNTLPGEPQGRGKLERWFRTMKEALLPLLPGFMAEVNPRLWRAEDLLTRSVLELRLDAYCEEYNNKIHSTTKETPASRYKRCQTIAGRAAVPLEQLLTLLPYAEVQRTIEGVKHAGVSWVGDALLQVLRDTFVRLYFDPYDKSIRHLVVFSGDVAHYLGTLKPHDPVARFKKTDASITARRNRTRLAS